MEGPTPPREAPPSRAFLCWPQQGDFSRFPSPAKLWPLPPTGGVSLGEHTEKEEEWFLCPPPQKKGAAPSICSGWRGWGELLELQLSWDPIQVAGRGVILGEGMLSAICIWLRGHLLIAYPQAQGPPWANSGRGLLPSGAGGAGLARPEGLTASLGSSAIFRS